MKRTSLSPIDILGITLGVLAALLVIGSIATIISSRMFTSGWSVSEGRAFWNETVTSGGAVRAEKDEIIPAGSYTAVELRTVAGNIDVTSSTTSALTVHSTRSAPTEAALENVTVEVRTEGSRLVVEERHTQGLLRSMGTVALRVTLPPGLKVVEAHSVSGDITFQGMGTGTDQSLSTISGSAATDAARNLDISSTSGNVSFTASGSTISAHTVSGSVNGSLAALPAGGRVNASSVSGSITLAAFAGLDAALTLHSVSGSVACEFPVTIAEQKRTTLRGAVGRGSATIDAGTVSGSIMIAKK
jgi:DUF4097 and DUF4098 domain-containing protein YvlB